MSLTDNLQIVFEFNHLAYYVLKYKTIVISVPQVSIDTPQVCFGNIKIFSIIYITILTHVRSIQKVGHMTGHMTAMLQEYLRLVTSPTVNPEVWNFLGCCRFLLGMYQEADEAAQKGTEAADVLKYT